MAAPSHKLVENAIPVLAVADVQASLRFYRDVLDFHRDWGGDDGAPQIASVSRDGHAIMLQGRSPAAPGCVWIGLSGLASLWEKIQSYGDVNVLQRPTNQPWALEMKIEDLDGNVLWFGSEPLKGVPFGQEAPEDKLRKS